MFPCLERRSVYDDYGEAIRPDDFRLAAEKAVEDTKTAAVDVSIMIFLYFSNLFRFMILTYLTIWIWKTITLQTNVSLKL